MQRKSKSFSVENKIPYISHILSSPYPVANKNESINSIVKLMCDSHNSQASFFGKMSKQSVQKKIVDYYAANLVKQVVKNKAVKSEWEDADVSILNASIREAAVNDKNIKYLCQLFNLKINSVMNNHVLKSAEQAEREFKELSDDMEKYMYDVNEACSGTYGLS
jgi:hypothetical protein